MATNPTSNTANTTVSDRTSSGIKPDGTPAVGTVASGSSSGVTSVSSGSSNVTVTSTGGGGTGDVTISVTTSGGSTTGTSILAGDGSGGFQNVSLTGLSYNNTTHVLSTSNNGNVVGPALGATNGNVALYDGTTGKLIKDGPAPNITIAGTSTALGGSITQDTITGLSPTTVGIVKHTGTANTLALATNTDVSNTFSTSSAANQVYATPNGTTGVPTLRSLVSADIPSLNYVASSGGTATNLTLAGTLKDSNSSSAGTSGQVLSSTATGTKWITPSSGGNVTGTGTSTSGNFAAFNNGSATAINDTGYSPSSFVSATTVESPHYVLAGPNSGSTAAAPTFRAIVSSDIPTLNQNTTGIAGSVTGLSVASGKTLTASNTLTLAGTDGSTLNVGTGGTLGSAAYTATSSYVAASSGTATNLILSGTLTANSSTGTSGYYLQSTGTGVQWSAGSGGLPSGGSFTQRLYTASGGSAAWQYDPVIYAEDYGLSTSNSASANTTALQNAVNAAASANGTLMIPFGTFQLAGAITIGTATSGYTGRIRIMGAGKKVTQLVQTSATDGFTVYMFRPDQYDNSISISDLTLTGGNTANSNNNAIYIFFGYAPTCGSRTTVDIYNVEATGLITASSGVQIGQNHGWTNGIAIFNGWNIYIDNTYVAGIISEVAEGASYPSSGPGSGAGFLISGCINAFLNNIRAEWFVRGISIPSTSTTWSSGGSYSVGQIVSDPTYTVPVNGINEWYCYASVSGSSTPPSLDPSHYLNCRLSSEGIQINNVCCLQCLTSYYANTTYTYLTNFLFDNGNSNNNFRSVDIENNRSSSYMIGGQVLQNGGANQIYVNGGTGLIISGVDFTNQQKLGGPSIFITGGSTNNIISNCSFVVGLFTAWVSGASYSVGNLVSYNSLNYICISAVSGSTPPISDPTHWSHMYSIQCDSGTSGTRATPNVYGYNLNLDNGSNYLGEDLGFQSIITLTGGTATELHYVNIDACKLGKQPSGAVAQVVSDTGISCLYYYQDTGNNSYTLALLFFMFNGTNLPNAAVRYSLRVGP